MRNPQYYFSSVDFVPVYPYNTYVKNIYLGLFLLVGVLFARDWSVFVYMVADNDLAQWADSDLVELQKVGSTDNVAIVVQVDKPTVGARRLYVLPGTVQEQQSLGVIDMCDWSILADFLEWAIVNYPAKKYCVILWDHGTGWTTMPQGTFGYDGSSGHRMSIANGDLRKAVSTARDHTGEMIDIFAFDACLMQQVEIAYELCDHGRVMIGFQSLCPLAGFRYDMIMDSLVNQASVSAAELAAIMVKTTIQNYTNVQPVACGAIYISALKTLANTMRTFACSIKRSPPGSDFILMRDQVQTIPITGNPPDPGNAFVDLGDWLQRVDTETNTAESQAVLDAYTSAIIDAQSWGNGFGRTTGLTVWFPYSYPEFKQLVGSYQMLRWMQSAWTFFLNWFYNSDDIRPTQVAISTSDLGNNNNFYLSWSQSFDLADVSYSVIECTDSATVFFDPCEDTLQWIIYSGFSLSNSNVHSGSFSFFSGDVSNADHLMITKTPVSLNDYGLLSWYLWCNTEDLVDSLTFGFGPDHEVYYGRSGGWTEQRMLIPPGKHILYFSYTTNASINNGGCYIDDIRFYELQNARIARQNIVDTSLYIFNKEQGEYLYFVRPVDVYKNYGNASYPAHITIKNFAVPYSNPNPFQNECIIVLDYPDSLAPTVEIFSLAGRSVRRFANTEIDNKTVLWDGRDSSGQKVGSGLYFVLVKDGAFKRIGKIARQR